MSENRTFAKVVDGVVVDVRCAGSLEWIAENPGRYGDVSLWVETWQDGSQRGYYAGIGYTYDPNTDTFTPPPPEDDDDSVA